MAAGALYWVLCLANTGLTSGGTDGSALITAPPARTSAGFTTPDTRIGVVITAAPYFAKAVPTPAPIEPDDLYGAEYVKDGSLTMLTGSLLLTNSGASLGINAADTAPA